MKAPAAHKTHGHKAYKVDTTNGAIAPTTRAKPAYAVLPTPPPPAPGQGISPSGQKALMFRARKELSAVSDPNQPITE